MLCKSFSLPIVGKTCLDKNGPRSMHLKRVNKYNPKGKKSAMFAEIWSFDFSCFDMFLSKMMCETVPGFAIFDIYRIVLGGDGVKIVLRKFILLN